MAIVFIKQKKKQGILVAVFVLTVIVIGFLLLNNFFGERVPAFLERPPVLPPADVEINFRALEGLEGFRPFEMIEEFDEEVGRENPFLPPTVN